jgi:tRNA G46 methylase TrmB
MAGKPAIFISDERAGDQQLCPPRGGVPNAQRRAYDTLLPHSAFHIPAQPLDPSAVFGRNSPKILEIGFSMGESTAALHADHNSSSQAWCHQRVLF